MLLKSVSASRALERAWAIGSRGGKVRVAEPFSGSSNPLGDPPWQHVSQSFSAGGGKRRVQVGVLDALVNGQGVKPKIVIGTLTGAIQALAVAQDDVTRRSLGLAQR